MRRTHIIVLIATLAAPLAHTQERSMSEESLQRPLLAYISEAENNLRRGCVGISDDERFACIGVWSTILTRAHVSLTEVRTAAYMRFNNNESGAQRFMERAAEDLSLIETLIEDARRRFGTVMH